MSASEPWKRFQDLLKQQKRTIARSDFLIDSDSDNDVPGNGQRGYGDDPKPSTSGSATTRDSPEPSTSGVRLSSSHIGTIPREETSD